ncbi:CTP synthetase [Salarchaeum sp. JOR-1]|uniref:DUF7126 family protein n=1 Tax=Salarchaeum sp. JOR-1 TaxID=2599399 RepID=UPI001198354E|nr:CTP synthetase [Salarchaeum sp. JOR-1]QDX40689.1 CTP synthetase [Salarchaeum sp. JOR-1]
MNAILVGPDRGLGDALGAQGVSVERIGLGSAAELEDAGVADADVLVLTDVGESTAVSVALELNDRLKTVVYSPDTIPEFVRGQLDLALDTELLDPDLVAEELAGVEA